MFNEKLKEGWKAHAHKIERIDGLCVVLAHPALWPISEADRPIWAAELPDLVMRDPWKQAALEARSIDDAIEEADRRFPCPDWHTATEWQVQEGFKVRRGRWMAEERTNE